MALLTAEDIAIYAPNCKLTGAALDAAIFQAQSIAESYLGANRPLEETPHREVATIHGDGKCYLSRFPIKEGSISIEVRGGDSIAYDLGLSGQVWRELEDEDFEVDLISGEVWIKTIAISTSGYLFPSSYSYRRPTMRRSKPQARISYVTGFDPESTDPLVLPILNSLRSALASIVQLRSSAVFTEGQNRFRLENFYDVQYGSIDGATASSAATGETVSLMDEYLAVFRRYRPRSYPVS